MFELAPLRRKDVVEAAKAHQIEPDAFVRELYAANAVPFAIKPLTLKMLLSLHHERGCLPSSNGELYTQGCLKLCEEQNKSRRDTRRLGRLNPTQRLRLAGRVAAATMLGNGMPSERGPRSAVSRRKMCLCRHSPAAANRTLFRLSMSPMTMCAKC